MTHPPASAGQGKSSVADKKPADAFGALTGTWQNAYFLRTPCRLAATLLACGGTLVCWFSMQEEAADVFAGNVWLLGAAGSAAIALAIATMWASRRIARRQQTYRLYKHGIRISGPQFQHAALYRDIEDIFYFNNGTCAFRTTPTEPWVVIDRRIRHATTLTSRLRFLHRHQRGARLAEQLSAGATITFRYMDDQTAQRVSRNAGQMTAFGTSELTINRHHLKIGQEVIDIEHIGYPTIYRWTNTMTVRSGEDGLNLHEMHAKAILSGEVLQWLILLIQARLRKAARKRKAASWF